MRYAMLTLMAATLALPLMTGCGDKVVDDKQTQSHSAIFGTDTTKDEKTYQRPDGSTYKTTDTQKSSN